MVEVGTDMLLEQESRLMDLTPFVKRDGVDLNGFYASILQQKVVDGRIMALPSYPEPLAVFYSKKWFDAAHLTYPQGDWTWEEHADIATKLTKIAPVVGGKYGTSIPFDINWIEPLVLSKGGSLLSPDGSTAKGYLDGPSAVEAVEWLAALIKNDVTAQYTDQWNNGYGYAWDLPALAGMSVGYYYKLPEYLLVMGDDLGVAPLPRFTKGVYANVLFTWGHGIRGDTENAELAWEFLRDMYLTDKRIVEAWAKTDLMTTRANTEAFGQTKNLLQAVFINEFDRSMYPTTLKNTRWSGGDLKIKLINPALRQIISTGTDVQTGLTKLAEEIDRALVREQ